MVQDQGTVFQAVAEAPRERWKDIIAVAKGEKKRRPRPIMPKEAAEMLGVCRRSLTRYEKKGILTPIRISSKKIRYDLNEVEALLTGEADAQTA